MEAYPQQKESDINQVEAQETRTYPGEGSLKPSTSRLFI